VTASPEAGGPTELGLDPGLEAAGLGLAGVLSAAAHDARVPPAWRCAALLPGARSAVVLASGGRSLFRAFRAAPEARDGAADPLDRFVRRAVEGAVAALVAAGDASAAHFAFEERGGRFADFVALGLACGLGAPSRLGLLVHPRFGPWLGIRAVLLTARPLPARGGGAPPGFAPCEGCPAPCATACHGAAVAPAAGGRFEVSACARTRAVEPACALRCDARRACPLGAEHAYDADAEAHHMRAAARVALRSAAP
jgi:hypothetical protein